MRLVAFSQPGSGDPGSRRWGVVRGETIHDLTASIGPDLRAAIAAGGETVRDAAEDAPRVDLGGVVIHAPLPDPGKIVCVGLNYHDHCREQGVEPPAYPMLFAKFANAVTDPGASVIRPRATEKLDLECELAVVIGRRASGLSAGQAHAYVFGYTVLNDVTARDLQREDRQWLRAKGWDGFAPIGPAVVTADELPDPGRLTIRSRVNGETWQDSTTENMIWDVPTLLAFITRSITLEPGDVVATGTPAGVGHFHDPPRYLVGGDVMSCEIDGIGSLENRVQDELPRGSDHAAEAGVERPAVRA